MAEEKKKFPYKLYAILVVFIVAAVLVAITAITFSNKYIAFDDEKVATNFVDSIVQGGDGYNAHKYTLVSKGDKYGDFVRVQYIYPLVYPGYSVDNTDEENDAAMENGYDSDEYMSDATEDDDGTLAGELADAMYDYYVELVTTYGWDDYDTIFSSYFEKLVEVRYEIFGDQYLDDDVMFTALESNVSTYSDYLTGTEEEIGDDDVTIVQEASTGVYQLLYGEDYVITTSVVSVETVEDVDSYVATLDTTTLGYYGIDDVAEIEEVELLTVECTLEDGSVLATQEVYEVKIGNTWYVDNLTTDTLALYSLAD